MLSGLHTWPSLRLRPRPAQPRLTGLTLHSSNFFPEPVGGIFWACFDADACNWRPFIVIGKEVREVGIQSCSLDDCSVKAFSPSQLLFNDLRKVRQQFLQLMRFGSRK